MQAVVFFVLVWQAAAHYRCSQINVKIPSDLVTIKTQNFIPLVNDGHIYSPFQACVPLFTTGLSNAFLHIPCGASLVRATDIELSIDMATVPEAPGFMSDGVNIIIVARVEKSGMFCINVKTKFTECDLSSLYLAYDCADQILETDVKPEDENLANDVDYYA
jgi:hypothetical protein